MGEPKWVRGSWTGTLAAARVTDHRGQQYDAAALDVAEGPGLERFGWGPSVGSRALLVNLSHRIRDPITADVKVGTRVRVRGRIMYGHPKAPTSTEAHASGTTIPVSTANPYQMRDELMILQSHLEVEEIAR